MSEKKQAPKENQPKADPKEDFAPVEGKSFVPEKGEEECYHVKLNKSITVANQKITTEETVQKFKPKAFNQFQKNAERLGYEFEVLYAPEKD